MHLGDDAKGVECSVCGIVGELMIKDGKVKFAFPPDQLEDAETDEYKRRAGTCKAFIQPPKPER